MSRTLNEITQDIARYHEALNASGGEIVAAAESLGMSVSQFEESYDKLAFEDAAKLDAYLYRLEQSKSREAAAQAMVDQWKERIKEWEAQVKAEQRDQEWMKSRLKFNMQVKGETKIKTAEGRTIAIQKNGGKVPLEINEDCFNHLTPGEIGQLEADGIVVMEPLLSKELLRKAIEEGKEFQFAKLGEVGTHLRIR